MSESMMASSELRETDMEESMRKADLEIRQRVRELDTHRIHQLDERVGIPWNQDVMSTLTDFYQVTMAYAYWKNGTHEKQAVFEVFFRTNPFEGEFTVLAGVNDVIRFVNTFNFDSAQTSFLKLVIHLCISIIYTYD